MKSRGAAAPAATGPDSRRRERFARYLLQVQCLARRLDRFFDALDAAGVLDGAVVVVLGDHGTRANERDPRPDSVIPLEPRYLVDNFSALFAARGPGVEPGLEERRYPLVKAFAEVFGHPGPPPGTEGLLLFQPGREELTPAPMPEF
jgi:arylsulfatase A-like enzyme